MKNFQIQKFCTKENAKAFAIISVLVLSSAAFAAGGAVGGGLDKLNSTAKEIKDNLIILVGTLSVVYLVWVGIQAFAEKKSWSDFGWAVIHVAIIGAISTIVTWAQGLFGTGATP